MGGRRKPFLELGGRPLLAWALDVFLEHPCTRQVVVALSPDDHGNPPAWLGARDPRIRLVVGGETRDASVRLALDALDASLDLVAVHDAARPFVDMQALGALIDACEEDTGAVVGYPVVDTVKEVDADGFVVGTPERSRLWQVQTPQVFPRALLEASYRDPSDRTRVPTDDAQRVEWAGGNVRVIRGSPDNVKVTFPHDLVVAEAVLERRAARSEPARREG